MNKKVAIKFINQELDILKDLVADFSESNNIHPLEIELALSKTTDITNLLLLLQDPSIKNDLTQKTAITEALPIEKPITKEELIDVKTEINAEADKKVVDSTKKTTPLESVIEEDEKNKPEVEVEIPEPKIELENTSITPEIKAKKEPKKDTTPKEEVIIAEDEKAPETLIEESTEEEEEEEEVQTSKSNPTENTPLKKNGILADKFAEKALSVNDMISSLNNDKNLAAILKRRPVTELRKSIKINDKIWYIKELFDNNNELYEETINHIEKLKDLNEVLNYLFKTFNWDQNNKSTVSFIELVYRRFSN